MNLQTVPLDWYIVLAAVLFAIGVVGVVTRRNAIIVFMAIEMMLNSVNLVFISFAQFLGDTAGQIFVLFVMAIAAGEAVIGLAIVLALFRNKRTVYVDEVNVLKW